MYYLLDHSSPVFEHDKEGRAVTIDTTVRAVRAFFSRYGAYKLAVPIGIFNVSIDKTHVFFYKILFFIQLYFQGMITTRHVYSFLSRSQGITISFYSTQ